MKRRFHTAAAIVLTLAAATAASADTRQIAASVGLGQDAADLLTLTEIARVKHNADSRQDEQVAMFAPVAGGDAAARSQLIALAGLSADEAAGMTLTDLVVAKHNNDVRRDDAIQVVVSSRSYGAGHAGRAQLIASAGLDPEAARSMTLQQIYVAKINAEGDNDQRVGAY